MCLLSVKADREKWNRLEHAALDAVNGNIVPDSQNSNPQSDAPKSIPVTSSTAINGLDLEDIDDFFDDDQFVPVTYPLKAQLALNTIRSEPTSASTSKVVVRSSSAQLSVSKNNVLASSSNLWSEIFTPCYEVHFSFFIVLDCQRVEDCIVRRHRMNCVCTPRKLKRSAIGCKPTFMH
jgi:hypothetical protein